MCKTVENLMRIEMRIESPHKVIIMGAGGVGKTSLVSQFVSNFFASSYKPLIEDSYAHTDSPDGISRKIKIFDTNGSEHFPAILQLTSSTESTYVLVFSVDSLYSFFETVSLYRFIISRKGRDVPILLVGNKGDIKKNERQVHSILIDRIRSTTMNNVTYVETSAKLNMNVIKLFHELLLKTQNDGMNLDEKK